MLRNKNFDVTSAYEKLPSRLVLILGVLLVFTGCTTLDSLRSSPTAARLAGKADTSPNESSDGLSSKIQVQEKIAEYDASAANRSISDDSSQVVPAAITQLSEPQSSLNYSTGLTVPAHVQPASCEVETAHFGCGCTDSGSCSTCSQACPPAGVPFRDVQEYVFDGGDQQPTVVIQKDWSAKGVEPTDTVIYYETLGGKVCVKPTNRVAIYAPRFGAVRQVSGAVLAAGAVGTKRILAPVAPGRFDDMSLAGTVTQPLATHGEEQVNLIDAFQENTAGTPVQQVLPLLRMSEARVPFSQDTVLALGRITDDEIAVLGKVIQNAHAWTTRDSLRVLVEGQEVSLLGEAIGAQDVHVFDMPDKCSMRICKTASHSIANSGDVVSFTIRFDNSGPKPVKNAVIMDSLSPRLEYIVGSQQCSVDVRFTAEPNEVGSQVLKWEIVAPIESNDGGAISFDCRVR